MKNRIIEASILAIGLCLVGVFIYCSVVHITDSRRVVSVKGLAEREVPADRVTWPIRFSLTGNDLPSLYDQTVKTNQVIEQFLTSNGIINADITIAAPTVYDVYQNNYSDRKPNYRYEMSSVVTVSSNNIEKVGELINRQGELMREGIAISSWGVNYEYTKLNEIKPDMIEEATKNSRQAAEQFANDSKSKVGKIQSATQGQFSITDRDDNSPNIKRVRVVTSVVYQLD